MATIATEAPSEATRLEATAEAGAGADTAPVEHRREPDPEKEDNLHEGAISTTGSPDPVLAAKEVENEPPPRSKGKNALIMFALCMAVFLAALDITIVTTALPTIAAVFGASEADFTWIGSAYLLAAAAATPSWGKISDIFGRKPVVLVANVIFFIGSLISAVSVNINMLIAGRVIQGIGGGGLIILVNICISDLFSMRDRGMYFGIVGMTWAIASALGPVLGGVFTQKVSWRWCFYINLPCDALAFVIIFVFLDIATPKTPFLAGIKAIDWLGSLLIIGGTVMFLLGLTFGGVSFPWASATVICLIIFGFVVIGLFFFVEHKLAVYPVIPLRIFNRRSNIAALVVCFCHGFVFVSGSYFLPLYFQSVLGATPILSGVYLFPFVLSLSFMSAGTGIFIRKTGQYLPPIYFGLFFMTLGFGLFINLPPSTSWPRIIIYQIIAGLGVGPNFQAPLIALQSLIQPRDIATATSTFGFIRNISTSISVVLGGVIFQNQMAKKKAMLTAALGPRVGAELGGGGATAGTAIVKSLKGMQRTVVNEAYTSSLRTSWIFYTCIAAVGLAASLLIGRQVLSKKVEVTKTGLEEQENARRERASEEAARRLDLESAGRESAVMVGEAQGISKEGRVLGHDGVAVSKEGEI